MFNVSKEEKTPNKSNAFMSTNGKKRIKYSTSNSMQDQQICPKALQSEIVYISQLLYVYFFQFNIDINSFLLKWSLPSSIPIYWVSIGTPSSIITFCSKFACIILDFAFKNKCIELN